MKDRIVVHPGRAKEAMAHVLVVPCFRSDLTCLLSSRWLSMTLMWRDTPENPKSGKSPKAKRSEPSSNPPSDDSCSHFIVMFHSDVHVAIKTCDALAIDTHTN
jgi:hypothetical protein